MRTRTLGRLLLPAAAIGVFALVSTADVSTAGAQPAGAQPPGAQAPGARPGPPGQPGGVQPAPVQPRVIQMQPMPPGMQPPGMPGMGRPRPMGAPGGMPPGHPAFPGAPMGAPHGHAEEPHEAVEHECPGHGPMDSPPPINWYQGLLGVNNEKAESPNALDRLLWRYKNDQDECDHHNQEPPVLANLINFGIVVFLLFRLGGTPLREGLIKRKKTIMQDIEAAEQLKGDAEDRLKKYQKQLANIEHRRKELEEEYRAQFEAEKKRILAEAEEKRVRMRKDAEFRVAQELRQAQADLLVEAVDSAIKAAEHLIKTKVQQADLDRMADDYLAGLGSALAAQGQKSLGGQS